MSVENVNRTAPIGQIEGAYFAFDVLAHPAKLVTLGALALDPAREFSPGELRNEVNRLQGESPGWQFTHLDSAPFGYCEGPLERAGLVVISRKYANGQNRTVRITDYGVTLGLSIVGALLPIAARSRTPPIQEILSTPYQSSAGGSMLRIAFYRALLQAGDAGLTTPTLAEYCKAPSTSIARIANELRQRGLITTIDPLNPANRRFSLSAPSERVYRSDTDRRTAVVLDLLVELQADGASELTGADIQAHIRDRLPDLDPKEAFSSLTRWVRRRRGGNPGFIQEIITASGNKPLQIALARKSRGVIRELLKVRHLVATDDKYRQRTAAAAIELLTERPDVIASVLARARSTSRRKAAAEKRWFRHIVDDIPTDGITIRDLFQQVSKRYDVTISYAAFQRSLARNRDIETFPRKAGNPTGHVQAKIYRFPANWQEQARCKTPTNRKLFSQDEETATPDQIESMKRVCRGCEVRRACLRTGLEAKGAGIWGGMTTEERDALSQKTQQRLLRTIIIEPNLKPQSLPRLPKQR